MLSDESGVTVRLFDFIVFMVECGDLLLAIEDKIREIMYDGFLRQKSRFHGDSFPDFNEIYTTISNDKIFLINYKLNKSAYLQECKVKFFLWTIHLKQLQTSVL